jgi:hypothetical protein
MLRVARQSAAARPSDDKAFIQARRKRESAPIMISFSSPTEQSPTLEKTMSADFADWMAICEVKARYCRCLDSKNWAGYAEVFTEDLILDTGPAGGYKVEGRDNAIRMIRSSVETAKTAHQVHNPEITFASDRQSADVIWAMNDRVIWGPDRITAMGDLGHIGYGHYREHYIKCPDGKWRIKRQELSYLIFDKIPLGA